METYTSFFTISYSDHTLIVGQDTDAWAATTYLPTFGLGWRTLFVIYAIISFLSISALAATPIEEEKPDKASGIKECVKLLGVPFILLCFLGIMCHVGIDVGTNTIAPKIIMERLALPLEEASFATGVYFIFRTIVCFLGAFILRYVSPKIFFAISALMMLAATIILFTGNSLGVIYTGIALVGFGNSNIFSIIFSQALLASPKEKNEVSGLMIMGTIRWHCLPTCHGLCQRLYRQSDRSCGDNGDPDCLPCLLHHPYQTNKITQYR